MLGALYLFICFLTGYGICKFFFPGLYGLAESSFEKKEIKLCPYFILLPAWFVTGTLVMTWTTYILAYLFRNMEEPLAYANEITMPVFFLASFSYIIWERIEKNKSIRTANVTKDVNETPNNEAKGWEASDTAERIRVGEKLKEKFTIWRELDLITQGEIFFLFFILLLSLILMWTTFFIKDNQLYVGVSVFSDFSPHIGMIRSFSQGNNFPTGYSHFAGEGIRYHFMFQFLVGNLEFLGMRLDYAFNVPSIFGFVSVFLLLYVLSVKISGKRGAGYIACLLFAFRSSESLFTYLAQIPKGSNILKTLADNTEFIGYTPNESWGLWNLNVYCNQRHLAFSLAVMLLLILLFLPYLYETFSLPDKNFKTLFLAKEGWQAESMKRALGAGILLGAIAFWNGAVLIATLIILFGFGILARKRLELIIVAGLTLVLAVLQSKIFIQGTSLAPTIYLGFIAENRTLFGALDYLKKLLGILPVVLCLAFLAARGIKKYLTAVFMLPLIFAFTISLTVDVTVNHKYIMMAVMLLGIIAADFLSFLYERKDVWIKAGVAVVTVVLISTGVYDFLTLLHKDRPSTAVVLNLQDDVTKWIEENASAKDIFLTSNYALNQVVLGGAMLYDGWQYYAWSAGYDTAYRDEEVKEMYEADTKEELMALVKENNIRFIVVDYDNRVSDSYELNEENIENTYTCVFRKGEGDEEISIYDTSIAFSK